MTERQEAAPSTARPVWTAGRRLGYVIAIVVDVLLILFINDWPTWRVFPFLTSATPGILWAFDGSLITAVAFTVSLAIAHRAWLLLLRDLVAAAWAIVLFVALLVVYPFRFAPASIDWNILAVFIIVAGIAGATAGFVVQVIRLARLGAATPHLTPPRA